MIPKFLTTWPSKDTTKQEDHCSNTYQYANQEQDTKDSHTLKNPSRDSVKHQKGIKNYKDDNKDPTLIEYSWFTVSIKATLDTYKMALMIYAMK